MSCYTARGVSVAKARQMIEIRVNGRTIGVEVRNCLAAFERFNALHFLAPIVR